MPTKEPININGYERLRVLLYGKTLAAQDLCGELHNVGLPRRALRLLPSHRSQWLVCLPTSRMALTIIKSQVSSLSWRPAESGVWNCVDPSLLEFRLRCSCDWSDMGFGCVWLQQVDLVYFIFDFSIVVFLWKSFGMVPPFPCNFFFFNKFRILDRETDSGLLEVVTLSLGIIDR
ncbi:hypothetical protein RchiOBHm_Chr7g0214741 [Rosa chinensis]|uniref:Uncharacterized protein n=1 Tax=Rosa chinensis TaxID=74649 RepID=A0A2P6PBC4_ROSCH|nr:hypothetical protein RchiOBHm_Chr7g0214741 [Rosa chinensis]